jgi:hypothetical protein
MIRSSPVWICTTFNWEGKAACPSKQIPEPILEAVTRDALGSDSITADALHNKITAIRVENGNRLVFCFPDGTEAVKTWADRSRAESWTPEMRESARQYAQKGNRNHEHR